jgi:hypothetical protein
MAQFMALLLELNSTVAQLTLGCIPSVAHERERETIEGSKIIWAPQATP